MDPVTFGGGGGGVVFPTSLGARPTCPSSPEGSNIIRLGIRDIRDVSSVQRIGHAAIMNDERDHVSPPSSRREKGCVIFPATWL